MAFAFESRPYGPDCTAEELQALSDCVFVYEPGIIYWRELPVQSEFQLDLFDRRLTELTRDMVSYRLLIDLLTATPPNAAIRGVLRRIFGGQHKLERAALFSGKNFIVNIASKLVATNAGLKNFTVYRTLEEALADLRHAGRG